MTRTLGSRHSTPTVAGGNLSREDVLAARPSVPDHVVYREFVQETVILNLDTGTYHGLNPSGGKMLQTLGAAPTVRAAAASLAAHYGRPLPAIEEDLYRFCISLLDRGLVELDLS
jgi:coenzyme PQQ synthesis protein D (PqqD)